MNPGDKYIIGHCPGNHPETLAGKTCTIVGHSQTYNSSVVVDVDREDLTARPEKAELYDIHDGHLYPAGELLPPRAFPKVIQTVGETVKIGGKYTITAPPYEGKTCTIMGRTVLGPDAYRVHIGGVAMAIVHKDHLRPIGETMKVTSENYVELALRTESKIEGGDRMRLIHAALGVQSEGGEIADALKKTIFYGAPMDAINLVEECGDVLWYLAILLDTVGYTLEEAMQRNIDKLRVRFPEKFEAVQALDRDLETEREVLEGEDGKTQSWPPCTCHVCGEDAPWSQFMLRDEVWLEVTDTKEGFAHLSCFEAALGRELVFDDFTDFPINSGIRWALSKVEESKK